MKVTTEALERCETLLTIELDPKKEQDMLQKAAKRISREVRIPGFRPGKAPFNTIVRRFGLEALQQEALESTTDQLLKEALDEANVKPFAQIKLEEVSWDPLVIKIKVPTQPNVALAEYREVRLESGPIDVTEEDIAEALKSLQEQHATWTPVERASQLGDLISMTVLEKAGETVLAENQAVEYDLVPLPEEHKGPDLITPLVGLSAGESKIFAVTYPEDYKDVDYAGKEITFSVDVSSVKEKELDPLDDDFAQQASDFDTLDELTADIKANLTKNRERQRDIKLGTEMLDKLMAESPTLEWPAAVEEEELDEELGRLERQFKNYGLTLDSVLAMQNKTREQVREENRPTVVDRMKRSLILGKVAEQEGLEVKQSEILQQAKAIADYSGGGESMWRSLISSGVQQSMIASDLISDKALMRLAAIARGETFEPEAAAPEPVAETIGGEEPAIADTQEA